MSKKSVKYSKSEEKQGNKVMTIVFISLVALAVAMLVWFSYLG